MTLQEALAGHQSGSRKPIYPRRRAVFAMVPVLCALSAVAASANVFDTDDRRPLEHADGFSAVGQIACENSTRLPVGTIVDHPSLTRDRDFELVVTVAHTFRGRRNEMQTRCHFLPGGDKEAATPVLHVALGTLSPDKAWHHDWAIALVAGRLSDTYGALQLATIDADDLAPLVKAGARYALVGKNGERPQMLISEHCGPVPKKHWHHGYFLSGEFNHDCDMIAGWSGGPLVLIHNGERRIIGINATELNGIVHKIGDPWHPRMFANTAIRFDGEFKTTLERLAATPTSARDLAPVADEAVVFSVLPESCAGTADTTSTILDLTVEIALVPEAQATSVC